MSQDDVNKMIEAKLSFPDKIILFFGGNVSHLDFSGLCVMKKYDQSEFDEINCNLKEYINGQ